MADIKNLEERFEKAQAKVEKCKGTIVRHEKSLGKKIQAVIKAVGVDLTGKTKEEVDELREPYRMSDESWLFYEVTSKLDDIKGATKKLAEAETIAGNWQDKLSVAINEEKFIEDNAPQVLKDFLEEWKKMAYEWHIRRYNDYQEFKVKIAKDRDDAIVSFVKANPEEFERYLENGEIINYWANDLINIRGKGLTAYLEENGLDWKSIRSRKADFAGGAVLNMDGMRDEEERLNWLDKVLEREKKAKLLDLCYRISKAVGEIVDASDLRVNQKGNLDGIIIGDKGKAKLETIGAGGWHIQVFHYRTLIHPIK